MRPSTHIACSEFPCGDVDHQRHEVAGGNIDPGRVRLIVVAEAPAADAADGLFARDLPFHLETTLDAFRAAGLAAASRRELEARGIYLTTAVKCAKVGYGVGRPTVEACSHLLEKEVDLFPAARVIMLMGEVAIGAFNTIARRRTGKRLIPSGPTWRARGGECRFEGKRVFPSYLPTGRSYLIERSKREMIAADLRAGLALIDQPSG
ncbi:MAG TPA: uracil-DNA glycosylase family protein [Acidimicrobiia bacterium]|nr:uracil-DNA glycosylase family protein [Acidimicrobiia bacterium]